MSKINLLFPIAGKGERFGGVFKPFLKIGDITFIEKTLESFGDLDQYDIFFICTKEQEETFDVQSFLENALKDVNFELIRIPQQTNGPCETISKALRIRSITGKTIVCDCDHYLDAQNIIDELNESESDVVIPIYKIKPDDYKNWSKVVWKDSKILKIVEKDFVDNEFDYAGIVGCVGFKRIEGILESEDSLYISEYLNSCHSGGKVISCVPARKCLFYGDAPMYEKALDFLRSRMTFFCDIDGVLIEHNPHSNCDSTQNKLILGYETLRKLKDEGHRIVLTTARNKKTRAKLIKMLKDKNIDYDDLIMSCAAGHRVLINDRKPSKPFQPQSIAFEVMRDAGLSSMKADSFSREFSSKILKDLSGNSFAKTYLIEKDGRKFVRKHIIKSEASMAHYEKLRRQFDDIKRLHFLNESLVPAPFFESDSQLDYFFDLEYLDGYKNLSTFLDDQKVIALIELMKMMDHDVYSLRKSVDGEAWMESFLDAKIRPKLLIYREIDVVFNRLICSDKVMINGKEYLGLEKILESLNLRDFFPKFVCPIHGDLTLENIMFDGSRIRMIDMDGSSIFDAPEHDLGKMSQSILSNYRTWDEIEVPVHKISDYNIECETGFFNLPDDKIFDEVFDQWSKILDKKKVLENAIFYMSCYFIRFVPFRMQKNHEHGYFALIMSIVWLSKLLEGKIK